LKIGTRPANVAPDLVVRHPTPCAVLFVRKPIAEYPFPVYQVGGNVATIAVALDAPSLMWAWRGRGVRPGTEFYRNPARRLGLQEKLAPPIIRTMQEFTVRPHPDDPRLTRTVIGIDQEGREVETAVVMERPLTLFLNSREIVTMMTIGDHPEYLAVGYLLNQNMLKLEDGITGIEYDADLETVVVRTDRETDFEDKLRKKTLTSGCAQGTVFGDLMENFEDIRLDRTAVLRTSWLYALTRKINTTPSLYLAAGAIHGCVLCEADRPLLYMEDVGRHNAIDKIAGYMYLNGIGATEKIFYTTGRLTSEMVIKTVQMRIPILISRSGFTAWGVDLARQAGLTLIGRAKGRRFIALAGAERIVFDTDTRAAQDEPPQFMRKGSLAEEDAA
jgi:FdhD protein